jgi:hypothetical protein
MASLVDMLFKSRSDRHRSLLEVVTNRVKDLFNHLLVCDLVTDQLQLICGRSGS